MSNLFITGIGHLTTNAASPISDAVVAIDDGTVTYAGTAADAPDQERRERMDVSGDAVIPGFVDAHTHLVFAGDRSDEFARRLAGESYSDIAASGGGILSTVEATRSASEETLFDLAARRVWTMIRGGTTTVEIKSGYGLDLETELRLLRVARRIGDELPVTVRTTFLGAHSVPTKYKSDQDGYVDLVINEMLPAVADLADFCDVFVEDGVFDVDEARTIFEAGKALGLPPRVHAEQLSHLGGAALAAEIGSTSADHLDHVTPNDAVALAEAGVTCVLVPGAAYTLGTPQPSGRMLWDAGCTVVISLGVVQMGLTVEEAIWAATRGGALSLGLEDRGQIKERSPADLVVLDAPSPAHIPYRSASNLVRAVIREGSLVTG